MGNGIAEKSQLKFIISKGSWYLASSLLTKVIGLFMMKVITWYLPPDVYGNLSYIDSISSFLPVLMSLGMDEAYYRFYFKYRNDKEQLKRFVTSYFFIIMLFGIIVFILSLIFGYLFLSRKVGVPFWPFIPIAMITPLLSQLSVLGGSYLKQEFKSELYSILLTATTILYYVLYVVLLAVPKMGFEAKFYAILIQNLILFAIYLFIMLKAGLFTVHIDFPKIKEGVIYGLPLLPNQLSYWVSQLSDRIVVEAYTTKYMLGLYSVSYTFGQLPISIIATSIFSVYKPLMYMMFEEKDANIEKKINTFTVNYILILIFIAFSISFFSKEILYVMTSKKYLEGYIFIPIVACAYFFNMLDKPFYNILSFHNKTMLISVIFVLQAIINIILNLTFIPQYGAIIAAYTTLLSYILSTGLLYIFSRKYFKVQLNFAHLSFIIIVLIAIFFSWNIFFKCFNETTFINIVLSIIIKLFMLTASAVMFVKLKVINIDMIRKKKNG